MSTVQVPAQLDVKHIIAAVKQLSPKNIRLPNPQQRHYEPFRRKCERQTLIEGELEEYRSLV